MAETLLIFLLALVLGLIAVAALLVARTSGLSQLRSITGDFDSLKQGVERLERAMREEMGRNREEASAGARQGREEMTGSLKLFSDAVRAEMGEVSRLQKNQLDAFSQQLVTLTRVTEERMERVREALEKHLTMLREDNTRKLEEMRATVDEKLHSTLEKRLGESFRIVSERLELVHKGLGEMQTLASGVGDLKRVLTNVKTRGTWGEIQLGNLLEQILSSEQFVRNVATKAGSHERVEYAIKLPGQDRENGAPVLLPIDAKFPQEDYQRLVDAQEQANPSLVEEAGRMLETRIKTEARTVAEKYLDPPNTTDFAIMFLPTEGLYAEVLRRPGLADVLQRQHRVVIAGPTTLAAILNSLQMGFRTLAIEQRSSEVWSLLGAVKTEFGRFGEILDKTQKKLQEASSSIESAATRSRAIERKLRDVQELPVQEKIHFIGPHENGEGD